MEWTAESSSRAIEVRNQLRISSSTVLIANRSWVHGAASPSHIYVHKLMHGLVRYFFNFVIAAQRGLNGEQNRFLHHLACMSLSANNPNFNQTLKWFIALLRWGRC
jgi:hypothetical protein